MTATPATPAHHRPEACFVCGGTKHAPTRLHTYWSNAQAEADFRAARQRSVRYSTGETTPEGQYVATTRGR